MKRSDLVYSVLAIVAFAMIMYIVVDLMLSGY